MGAGMNDKEKILDDLWETHNKILANDSLYVASMIFELARILLDIRDLIKDK